MNCSKVQTLLSAYLDREVSGNEMLAIRDHLRDCECCREEERTMRAVKSLLCNSPVVEPDPGFEERLCARVGASVASREAARDFGRPSGLQRLLRALNLENPRPVYAYATVGLTACAVLVGVFVMIPNRATSGSKISGQWSGGGLGTMAIQQPAGKTPAVAKADKADRRFMELLDRDHAYITSADPLSGPQVALATGYGRR